MHIKTLIPDITIRLRRERIARQAAALRKARVELVANACLWAAGGMCGLATVIFMAAFVGLLP